MAELQQSHPDQEQLRSFNLGKLDDPAASSTIEWHLETCAECRQHLETIAGDTLESLVRGCGAETAATADSSGAKAPAGEATSHDFLAAPQANDEIGRLGGYRVLKLLGAGGMGLVFQAEDIHLKRKVALKVMKPEAAAKAGARERFLREAQAAAAIEHEHIVAIQ